METVTLKVGGMTCGGCVASVTRVLKATPGVDSAKCTPRAIESGSRRGSYHVVANRSRSSSPHGWRATALMAMTPRSRSAQIERSCSAARR